MINMKKTAMFLGAMAAVLPAFAEDGAAVAAVASNLTFLGLAALGAGIAIGLAAFGAASGQGKAAASARTRIRRCAGGESLSRGDRRQCRYRGAVAAAWCGCTAPAAGWSAYCCGYGRAGIRAGIAAPTTIGAGRRAAGTAAAHPRARTI